MFNPNAPAKKKDERPKSKVNEIQNMRAAMMKTNEQKSATMRKTSVKSRGSVNSKGGLKLDSSK